MRNIMGTLAALGALGMAACTPPAAKKDSPADQAAAESACPDDGPRFAGTGLCVGRSVNYMNPEAIVGLSEPREGCTWEPNETMMMGDEALIYLAASCDGVKTELEFRGGARSASLGYVKSGIFPDVPADYEPVRIFTLEGDGDKKANLLRLAVESAEDKAEAASCEVVPYGFAPAGALVVDVSAAHKKANKARYAENYAACGPFGILTDAQRFWVIKQGYGWFFDFGQDMPDFVPGSLTLMRKGADGNWAAVEDAPAPSTTP